MKEFALTKKQVLRLAVIAERFPESQWFVLEEDNSSGIGPMTKVKFCVFDRSQDYDTMINITDIDTW
jgi:hypothetical protein